MLRAVMISLALTLAPAAAFAAPADGRPEGQVRLADGDAITLAITVVHARPSDGGVAPELDKLSRYLLKSFPKHKSFVRLSATSERLAVGAKGSMTLPNGIELVFGHTGWKDGFAAVHIEVGGLTSTVNVKDGGVFFQAGRAYEGGMLVLAFEVASAR